VLLLITPFLANYLVMNLTLFVILFGLGFLTARMAGINFWILLAYLIISVFVGLNPQQPVDSQTIIDSFIGLIVGMFIGPLVSEEAGIGALLRQLQALVPRIGHLVSYRKNLPQAAEPRLRPKLERLESEFHQMLDTFSECFRQGDCRREFPILHGAVNAMDETVQEIRQSGILNVHKVTEPLRMLDLLGRYHAIADNLEECSRLIRQLRIERYWRDYAL